MTWQMYFSFSLVMAGDESIAFAYCIVAPLVGTVWGWGCICGFVGYTWPNRMRAFSMYPGMDRWTLCAA